MVMTKHYCFSQVSSEASALESAAKHSFAIMTQPVVLFGNKPMSLF